MLKNKKLVVTAICLSVIMLCSCVCVALDFAGVVDVPLISLTSESTGDKPSSGDSSADDDGSSGDSGDLPGENPEPDKPSLTNFKADYFDIYIGKTKDVTFTVNANEAASSFEINVFDESGDAVCKMNDDGKDGDKTAGDGVFTGVKELLSDEVRTENYYAACSECESNVFELCFYRNITDEEFESFMAINSEVNNMTFTEAKNYIAQSEEVESYDVDDEKMIITYRTKSGITGVWQEFNQDYKGSGAYSVPVSGGIDYTAAKNNIGSMSIIPAISDTDVAVLRPYRYSDFQYDDFQYAGECLRDGLGGNLNVFNESDVTLSVMKTLDEYGIVLIDSHGTLINDRPYMIIGETASMSSSISADLLSERVCVTSSGRFCVGGGFFGKYLENDSADESLWYLGTCYSAYDASITGTLTNKGADAVYGFDMPVTVSYCNELLFEIVINSMLLSGDTAWEGFENAKDVYGDYCDSSSGRCNPVFAGYRDYVLTKESAHSDEREICLVLDISGSMDGRPLEETKKASVKFIETVLGEEGCISVITYESSARMVCDFSTDGNYLENKVNALYSTGGTNIDSGLVMAHNQLKNSKAKKRIIVLMSDGEPNDGRVGDALVSYSDEIKDDGIIIYTLGFFDSIGDKTTAQKLMEDIASPGFHYEVDNAGDLVFFFGDIADQINGERYIHIRIACPVDVKIEHKGQVLDSSAGNMNVRTDFGSLTFEEIEGSNDLVKIVRLKEKYADSYDVKINGTGTGTMDYTISFSDENGDYTDERFFEDVEITETTLISSKAKVSGATYLDIDKNGDGVIDLKYKAEANSKGVVFDDSFPDWAIWLIVSAGCLIVFGGLGIVIFRKYKKYLATRPPVPETIFCRNCGTKGIKGKYCNNCGELL